MPDKNELFVKTALSKGYTKEQISNFLNTKAPAVEVANPKIIGNENENVLRGQSALQDFVGSGWNAAVDMVKSVPMIAKAVNDTTVENDSFSNAMKVTSDAIDKHLKYTIAPDYNKGIVELNEDGSMSLTNFRSLFNGIGNGVGQVGLAMATGGNNVYGRLAANTLMNFPSVYESAEKAGLNKKDAARFSLLLAPILGATEEIGGVQPYLAKSLFGKVAAVETKQIISKLRNEAITETLEKAAKGELTEEAFGKLAKETSTKYLAKIKELAPETLKEMAGEGGQEMFQDALQQGAEQIYDKFFAGNAEVGKGKFGTELISTDPNNQLGGLNVGGYGITKKGFVSLANNGILGGLIGGSAHIAIHKNPEFLQETLFGFIDDNVKNGQGESAMKRINALVNLNIQQQKITPQDGEVMLKKAQQIYDVADRWKNVEHEGMTNSERYKAYDLTANVLPMLDAPIKQFEDTFGASDLPGALANIETNDKVDDFQKGAMKQSAVDTFGNYYKAIQKRDVIKSYLQQLGNSGKATDLNAQIKAIDALSVNEIFNKVGMESVAPKNAVTKAIHDELNIENELLPNNTIEQNGEVNQEDDSLRENKSGLEEGSQVRGGQSKGQESGLESNQENALNKNELGDANSSPIPFNLPKLDTDLKVDENQLNDESTNIDTGIVESSEGEEEAAILHSIGLSLENQSGIGKGENNGVDKASQSDSERQDNGENNATGNKSETAENGTSKATGSKKSVQQSENGSNKSNTKNLNQNDGEVQNNGGTSEKSGQANTETKTSEGQTSSIGKGKRRKKAKGTPKSRRTINNPDYKKAISHEISSAEDLVLKTFIGGAKVQYSVIQKMYKNAKGEAQKKKGLLSKNGYSSIDEMAHALWQDGQNEEFGYQKFDAEELSNAIEDVLNSHYVTRSMVDDINNRFDNTNPEEDENYIEYLRQEQERDKQNGYTQSQIDDTYAALYGLNEQEIEQYFNDRDDALLQMHLDSLDTPLTKEEIVAEQINEAENELEKANSELKKAEADYQKKKENFDKNLSEDQIDMFGQNKTPSMFDDKAMQQQVLDESKKKLDSARESVKKAEEKLQSANDKVGQEEIKFEEKTKQESKKLTPVAEYINTKTGEKMFITRMATRLSDSEYTDLSKSAKTKNGFYSRFAKGFLFKTKQDADAFFNKENESVAQFATGPQIESTTTEKEQAQKIIDFFQQGMKLDVFAPASEYESALTQATKGKELLSDTGQPIGFVLNGRIHLNPKTLNPEKTFHELIHVQQQLIKEAAKKGDAQAEMILKRFNVLLGDAVSKIMAGNRNVVIDGVKVDLSSSVYDRASGEADLQYRERLRDELWSYIQAPVNEKKWNEGVSGMVSRFIDAVKKFFKEKLGLKDASNLQSMTLAELVDASAVSLMKGEYFENADTAFQGVETPVKADPNKVYRVASNADTATGKDVSFSSGLNWYEGQGFIIEANKGKGDDIAHHSDAKRGEILPSDVTTVYYEPNGFATDSETVYSELPKMRKQFPNAQFIQIKYGETPQGKADLKSVGMESRAKSGQPLFAIAPTTTPLIDDIKQTPELLATKETIPTMSFPLELVKIKNMIGSGVNKLGNTVPPSVAVSDYLTKYINKILEYKAYNSDGTEKRYAFVGKLEDLRSSLGKASTVPLLENIYDNIINKEPLTKEASGLLNALTEYHIQYNRVQQTNDAIVIDSDTIYNRDEVKDMAMEELAKGKEAVRVKMLENSKYGKPIATFLEKYTLAVSSLPTWAKILAGGEKSMLYKLVKALDSAQDKQYVMAETAKSYLSQIQDKISTGSTFNTNDITKSAKEEVGKYFEKYSGIKTKISEGELLHIYLTLKNDQVRSRFFKNGGSGVFELKEYRDKNDRVLREHLSIDMTEADYSNLESNFSTPEWSSKIKAWTDANEFLYKYVDQTHREDTGISLRKADGFYYPLIHGTGISSYEDYLKQNKFVDDLRSAKARSPQVHANYLVVDALQLMNNHVDASTKYASYATPLKNIDVYLKNSDEFFRKNDMIKYVEWYNKFKKEFEDPTPDKMGEIGKRIMSGFVVSRLGLNPFVTLKQYSSIFVSNNVIPSKYIVSSLDELAKNAGGVIKSFIPGKTIPFDKTMNEMLEHSATARRRLNAGQNYFDELVKSGIKDYETVVFGKNIKVPFSKMTNNIAAADRAVSALYWVAAKKQVSAETNFTTGSREYWNAVNDIYSKAVIESQSSMDDVNRPHMTKDANILVKGLTLFSGQSFSNFNSFIGNVIEHANNPSKDNKMKVARSIMNIYVYNALMVAAVDSLKYAQNGDDEDKLKKKAFRSLISNSYQNIPIVAPIVDEIWSKVENPRFAREINYPVLQVINDGASLIGNLSNEKFDKAVTDGIKFGAEGIGLPAYPIESVQKIYAK